MPKGFFSQGLCLLTDGSTTITGVKRAVEAAGFSVVKEVAASDAWALSGPAFLVAYRREVNGGVTIDVVNQPWPDAMGDPKSDVMTFGAWGMGHFGPFAYPGGLQRAMQQPWDWPAAKTVAPQHRGFVRIRSSYVGGGDKNAKVLPADYEPVGELQFVSRLIMAASAAPGVLCYFNPNGEILRDPASFRSTWHAAAEQNKLPLLLWANVRLYKLDETYFLMDTVGNSQFDVRDVEVIAPKAEYSPDTLANYLRNVSHYLLDLRREIQTGEAIDGPGERGLSWVAESRENAITAPPRRVLRLCPKTHAAAIYRATNSIKP